MENKGYHGGLADGITGGHWLFCWHFFFIFLVEVFENLNLCVLMFKNSYKFQAESRSGVM